MFAEDLSVFFDPKDFGDAVVFHLVPAAASISVTAGPSFKLTAVTAGFSGNDISFTIVAPDESDASLAVTVDATDIVVSLATDSDGVPITTGTELAAALAADEGAAGLVTLSNLTSASTVVTAADPVNLAAGRGGDLTCNAILDHPGVQAQTGPRGRLETDQPELWCRTSDVLSIKRDDTVTARGETYEVVRKEADGTGVSVVYLAPDQ